MRLYRGSDQKHIRHRVGGNEMKVFVVVKLDKAGVPAILGVYKHKKAAMDIAYSRADCWCNVIEQELIEKKESAR